MASNWTLVSDFSQTGSNFGKPTSVWDIGGSALVKTVLCKKGGSLPLMGRHVIIQKLSNWYPVLRLRNQN